LPIVALPHSALQALLDASLVHFADRISTVQERDLIDDEDLEYNPYDSDDREEEDEDEDEVMILEDVTATLSRESKEGKEKVLEV